ncbi:class I SAM-dependent methyltransferase [Seongchinamella sediminis]|uniref:class I SAM-dependent methyltransferase n=1 Tax=Seongchinamella sediminis TaxID=2283635 RepID=UPI001EF04540|nr:histidine kinase [Seongchinamella sediminis]
MVWDSSQVLARLMVDFEIGGKRILEVGCGMALSSLLLNRRGGDITATDYHPETGAFLQINTGLNEDRDIPYFRADWDAGEISHGLFDLIIGSDLLYERSKVPSLARFIQDHALPRCEVLVVDPGRRQQGQFSKHMSHYGFSYRKEMPGASSHLEKPFSGSVLRFRRG